MRNLIKNFFIIFFIFNSCIVSAQVNRCPVQDKSFKFFFERFIRDSSFQRARIVYPLVYRYGDYRMGEPTIELWDAKKLESISYPLIRNKAQRDAERVQENIVLSTERYVEVFHDIPDGDSERILYKFRNVDNCWYLEEVHDKSQ